MTLANAINRTENLGLSITRCFRIMLTVDFPSISPNHAAKPMEHVISIVDNSLLLAFSICRPLSHMLVIR